MNEEQYNEGYEDGLEKFCTYKSGYQFDLEGNLYNNTCSKKNEDRFFEGYALGKKHQQELNIKREYIKLERERVQIEKERVQAEIQAERAKAQAQAPKRANENPQITRLQTM